MDCTGKAKDFQKSSYKFTTSTNLQSVNEKSDNDENDKALCSLEIYNVKASHGQAMLFTPEVNGELIKMEVAVSVIPQNETEQHFQDTEQKPADIQLRLILEER